MRCRQRDLRQRRRRELGERGARRCNCAKRSRRSCSGGPSCGGSERPLQVSGCRMLHGGEMQEGGWSEGLRETAE